MRKIFLLIVLISSFSFGQKNTKLLVQKNDEQKLINCINDCEKLVDDYNYKSLVIKAQQGISLSKNNQKYLAKFYFYEGYGFEYDNNLYFKAVSSFEKSLQFAQKIKNIKSETDALMRLNYLYYSTKQHVKRDIQLLYIKKIVDTTKNIYAQGVLNGSIGEYYLFNSDYDKFIVYKLKAIEFLKKLVKMKLNSNDNIAVSYEQIAGAYIKMKQFEKGFEYVNYAKDYIANSKDAKAFICNMTIQCYLGMGKLESAKKQFNELNKLITSSDSLFLNVSFANRVFSDYFLKEKKIKIAYNFAKKASLNAVKSNDEEIIMESNIAIGNIQFVEKKYSEAIITLTNAAKIARNYDKEYYVSILKTLSKSYACLKKWEQAYEYNEIYNITNDSLLVQSAKQSIANAEAAYQNKSKKQQIASLSSQNKIKNLQISNAQKQKWFYVAGIGFFIILGGLLFYQNRRRKQNNLKLETLNQDLTQANQAKTRFFGILNHDLRGPVNNLVAFLQLQQEAPEMLTEENTKRMQAKTMTGAQNLLASMEDILQWSKSQMENFKPQPKSVLIEKLFNDNKKVFSGYLNIKIEYENPNNIEVLTDENYLKTIIRNLTSNAINVFTDIENPCIIWKGWQENATTYFSITDNGPGASSEKFNALFNGDEITGTKSGLGLHLIRDMAKAINCEIVVDSEIGKGTTFTLKLAVITVS